MSSVPLHFMQESMILVNVVKIQDGIDVRAINAMLSRETRTTVSLRRVMAINLDKYNVRKPTFGNCHKFGICLSNIARRTESTISHSSTRYVGGLHVTTAAACMKHHKLHNDRQQ
jgi:hypothetical protein